MVELRLPQTHLKSVWIYELKQGGEAYGKTPLARPSRLFLSGYSSLSLCVTFLF